MSWITRLPSERYQADAFETFEPGAIFRLGTARALAWTSQLAYEEIGSKKMLSILERWGMSFISPLSAKVRKPILVAETYGFVAKGRGAVVVAFAGTDPLKAANWITDFDIRHDRAATAAGFEIAAESVMPQVLAALRGAQADGSSIYVTGHSLGGALAVLVGRQLVDRPSLKIGGVYTFGMPRPGQEQFALDYDRQLGMHTYRLVHGDDIVPTVAPEWLGFRHVGRYLYCATRGKFAAENLLACSASNEPLFKKEFLEELRKMLSRPWLIMTSVVSRLALAARLLLGMGPPGIRHDLAGIAIELLPPRLRDHMPDRYINALSVP